MQRANLTLDQLVINPNINPRHETDNNVDGLVASIMTLGFTDPPWVYPIAGTNTYGVIDGKRRRMACLALTAQGRDYSTIPCDIFDVDEKTAIEMALAAAITPKDLSPADEAQAFYRLKLSGMDDDTIASHFALPVRRVKQRIAIGTLPEKIIQALRHGQINLATAESFTLSSSAERQLEVFENTRHLAPHVVKNELTTKTIDGTSREARFVGVADYEAAGGTVSRDLFSNDCYFHDAKLLHSLFEAKLTATAKALKDEGWAHVEVIRDTHKFSGWATGKPKGSRKLSEAEKSQITSLKAEHEELLAKIELDNESDDYNIDREEMETRSNAIEAELLALEAKPFTAGQMKKGTAAIVFIWNDGVAIYRGVTKLGAQNKKIKHVIDDEDGDEQSQDHSDTPSQAPEPIAPASASYSDALEADLAAQVQYAVKLAMVKAKPALAARMGLAARVLDFCTRSHDAPFKLMGQATLSGKVYEELSGNFQKSIPEAVDFSGMVAHLESLTPEQLVNIEALLAADCFEINAVKNPDVQWVISQIDPDMSAEGFAPTEEFLKRLGREQLVDAIAEIDPTTKLTKAASKTKLLEAALNLIGLHGWMPRQMRGPSYKGPGSAAWQDAIAQTLIDQAEAARAAEHIEKQEEE
jgi:ParB/RepB/Spo0J family partition protein